MAIETEVKYTSSEDLRDLAHLSWYWYGGNEQIEDLNSLYYGHLYTYHPYRRDIPETLVCVVDFATYSDYSGSLVEKSNCRYFLENFPDDVIRTYGGHGTEGIALNPHKVTEEVYEALCALENYPLLDDELHSELETEAVDEAWESWCRADFIKAVEKLLKVEINEGQEGKVYELFCYATEETNEYWVNEQGDQMWINAKRVAKCLELEDLDHYGLGYVAEENLLP
jgi:hypothetical protein